MTSKPKIKLYLFVMAVTALLTIPLVAVLAGNLAGQPMIADCQDYDLTFEKEGDPPAEAESFQVSFDGESVAWVVADDYEVTGICILTDGPEGRTAHNSPDEIKPTNSGSYTSDFEIIRIAFNFSQTHQSTPDLETPESDVEPDPGMEGSEPEITGEENIEEFSITQIDTMSSGTVFTTVQDGNWTATSTWLNGNAPPLDGKILATQTVNVLHNVRYNVNNDLINFGTLNVGSSGGPQIEFIFDFIKNMVNEGGTIKIINTKLDRVDNFQNTSLNGTIEIIGSFVNIGQNLNSAGGTVKIIDSCIYVGENVQFIKTTGEIRRSLVTLGLKGSGNFQLDEKSMVFESAQFYLAGTSGDFQLTKGTISGSIAYIALDGGGKIEAKPDIVGTVSLDRYKSNFYDPQGKFTGAQTLDLIGPYGICNLIPADDPSIELVKTANPTTFSQAGDVISYSFTVTNTGNVTLTNITLSDPVAVVSGGPIASLAPGASDSMTFTATYTITQADVDAGEFVNTATVTGKPPTGPDVKDEASATVTGLAPAPSIALVKTANPTTFSQAGDVITYSFTVTNTGNVTLTNITLSDPVAVVSGGPIASLAPGASDSTTFTATYTITQANVAAGEFVNTATVTGKPPTGPDVKDEASATVTGPAAAPSISLVKTANPAVFSQAGDVINYTFVATNNGVVTLTNVTITDPLPGLSALLCDKETPVTLVPGTSLTCTAIYTITAADITAGQVANTATASAKDPEDRTVEDTDEALVERMTPNPSIRLSKTASPAVFSQAGDVITYIYIVTNNGNLPLTNVAVTETAAGFSGTGTLPVPVYLAGSSTKGSPAGTLLVGEGATYTATYTVTQADVNVGLLDNVAAAAGEDPEGTEVTDTDDERVAGPVPAPSILISKTASPAAYNKAGDVITYIYLVTNNGNVPLTNVTVTEEQVNFSGTGTLPVPVYLAGSSTKGSSEGSLLVGEGATYTATYVVTQADVNAGLLDNVATASGEDPGGSPVTDTDDERVEGPKAGGSISLVKTANPAVFSQAGDVITYTFVATNNGVVTLTNVTITDPLPGLSALSCTPAQPATLAPGASLTCTATYTITAADITAGQVANTATASAKDPEDRTVEDTDEVVVVRSKPGPSIRIIKLANPRIFSKVGEKITFTFIAINNGDQTLTNVTITDPLPGLSALTCNPKQPATLVPGATMICTATYVVTEADMRAGKIVNLATVSARDPNNNPVTDSTTVTVPGPSTKVDPRPDPKAGGNEVDQTGLWSRFIRWLCRIGIDFGGCRP